MAIPRGTTGSLCPTFVSARLVSLAVRQAYAIALNERFPTAQSLPSILHKQSRIPVQSYSKGARGLSVWPQEPRIFTGNSVSLSLCWRQRGSRYAIRAGRNLPDKEFRYLRTVIVTAAVYRGFDSRLAPLLLTFRHRAGVRPYTSSSEFAEPCVFAKQSPPPGLCHLVLVAQERSSLSRSYGGRLPSSFSIVSSSTLVCSTSPPVSVWGTVYAGAISWNSYAARGIQ